MNSKKTAIRHDNSSSDCSHAMVEDLWLDKHAPTSLKELAMHVRKVNDIKSWIERALAAHDQAQRSADAAVVGVVRVRLSTSSVGNWMCR